MIKAIFFDFDGTICDTYSFVSKDLIKIFDELDYEYDKLKIKKHLGEKTSVFLKNLGFPKEKIPHLNKLIFKKLMKDLKKGNLKLCSSLKPLKKLKKKYKLIIVSNANEEYLFAMIKKLKIKNYFDEVYGMDELHGDKARLLKKLFKKLKIKPKEAVYVGDRFSDIRYANKVKCISIATHNKCSWSSLDKIVKEKPSFIISNFDELEKIIHRLN